jgi:UDP-N-acetylmuramoylalanine-D-glutamate ligase
MPRIFAAVLCAAAGCGSGDPKQSIDAALSAAAAAHMLVQARVNGHTTRSYTERTLQSERQEAHTLASELEYEKVPPQHRVDVLDVMSRLEKVLDETASDASARDTRLLARHAASLDSIEHALDSLSSEISQR